MTYFITQILVTHLLSFFAYVALSLSFILPWYTELISCFALNLFDNIMTRFRNSCLDRHTVLQLQGVKGSRWLRATGVRSDVVPA